MIVFSNLSRAVHAPRRAFDEHGDEDGAGRVGFHQLHHAPRRVEHVVGEEEEEDAAGPHVLGQRIQAFQALRAHKTWPSTRVLTEVAITCAGSR